jgi:urease gamma subunit
MKFRKKPVVIDALRVGIALDAAKTEFDILPQWLKDAYAEGVVTFFPTYVSIVTLEGTMHTGRQDDWIIRGVAGELYPCRDDIFQATYEKLNDVIVETAGRDGTRRRLVTVHICATETGISASYPEGSSAAEVASLLWEYIREANERGERFQGPIRGLYQEKPDNA